MPLSAQTSTAPPVQYRLPSRDCLARLVVGGAITTFQADWIESIWPKLDEDAFAHPYLQTVREHTRAYLEAGSAA